MAKFLNNIDLNKNQLIKAVIHPLSTAPANPVVGQVYYDNEDASIYVCTVTSQVNAGTGSGTTGTWKDLGGDITGITLTGGNGVTATNTNSGGGAYSSTITLDISDSNLTTATAIAQADLLAFSDESETNQPTGNITFSNLEDQIFGNISSDATIAAGGALTLAAAQTNITSVYNTALKVGGDAETMIDFGTSDEIKFKINNTDELKLTGAALIPIVDNGLDLGTSALGFRHLYLANNANSNVGSHLTFNKDRNGNGSAGQDGDDIGQFHFHSFNDASTPEAIQYGRIRTEIDDASDGSEAGRMTLSVRAKNSIANGLKIVGSDSADGVVDVTLGSGAASTTTIAGNLTVSGTTTTVNSTVVTIADPLFELGASSSDDNLDRGIIMKYNNGGAKKAFMGYDDSAGKFTMITDATDTSSVISGTAGTLVMSTFEGALTGNASTATKLAAGVNINGVSFDGSAAITVTAAGSTLSDVVTVAKGGTGLSSLTTNALLIGNGTGNVTLLSKGANNAVLQVDTNGVIGWGTPVSSASASSVIIAALATTQVDGEAVITDEETFLLLSNVAGTSTATARSVKTHEQLAYNPRTRRLDTNITGAVTGNASTATVLAAGAVGGVKVFELTHGVGGVTGTTNNSTNSATWTITHGMGASFFYKVEVLEDSAPYQTVYVDVTRPSNASVKLDFGAAVANGAYRAMLTRMA
tara:strand:- start:29 stop:2128 length:2100 start_codon:yes stop_codon:yes gene_type:complete